MASGKGRQGLDKPDGQTLIALDRALAEFADHGVLRPGEFTIQMMIEKNPSLHRSTLNKRFNEMVRKGVLAKRKITQDSNLTNAYRYAD
jgi:hypothetical protein